MKGIIICITFVLSILGLLSFLSLRDKQEQEQEEIKRKSLMVIIGTISFFTLLFFLFQ